MRFNFVLFLVCAIVALCHAGGYGKRPMHYRGYGKKAMMGGSCKYIILYSCTFTSLRQLLLQTLLKWWYFSDGMWNTPSYYDQGYNYGGMSSGYPYGYNQGVSGFGYASSGYAPSVGSSWSSVGYAPSVGLNDAISSIGYQSGSGGYYQGGSGGYYQGIYWSIYPGI